MHRFWNLCTRQVHDFSNLLIYLYRNELTELLLLILLYMHPVCAQNKSVISNTEVTYDIVLP